MTANGSHAAGDAIDDAIASLTKAAEAAQRIAADKRIEYEQALDKARRLTKALDALQPPPKQAKKSSGDWTITDEKVASVLEAIKQSGLDEFTATDLERVTPGLSISSAGKALGVLREREVVRFVRSTKGGGKVHALMPDQR